ncbi:MAG TPA: ABC transporter permease subunit [Pseudonocardiaceae bacterium]
MIWLTWRLFRGPALAGTAALAALAAYLVVLGLRLRDTHAEVVGCAGCTADDARGAMENGYFVAVQLSGFALVVVPALLGAFWGAPLVARELEAGTHRLVWAQSVTRGRWLAVRLGVVVLAGVLATGLVGLLLGWAVAPYDEVMGGRFETVVFPSRGVVPLGYAAFAVALGATLGLLARRTLPAMALTLAVFLGLQFLVPTLVRPHLRPPVTETFAFGAFSVGPGGGFSAGPRGARVEAVSLPGAWVLSDGAALHNAAGEPVTSSEVDVCMTGEFRRDMECIGGLNLSYTVSYHPAARYWPFQWIEFGGYLLLAALLTALSFVRLRRVAWTTLLDAEPPGSSTGDDPGGSRWLDQDQPMVLQFSWMLPRPQPKPSTHR